MEKAIYQAHDTVTESGIHTHINYLDYQMWLYRQKLEQVGVSENTVVIFCLDVSSVRTLSRRTSEARQSDDLFFASSISAKTIKLPKMPLRKPDHIDSQQQIGDPVSDHAIPEVVGADH